MPMGYWRDSSRVPRFFLVDAWAALPLLLFLLHIRMWTFITAIIATIFFATIERYGFSMLVFLRWLRNFLGGSRKKAIPWWR
ncbi:MAG: IcmT/TraK family protein [Gammaproteobacteria bacterium]|nr:IcmT/TraK family protein [Gammaproteobacteria bacterium]